MALNPSGPISLGGSTVGQSINLELGNSATATASINSSAFRTLAGVPSGQISLSNFYGKSNTPPYFVSAISSASGFSGDAKSTTFAASGSTYVYAQGSSYPMLTKLSSTGAETWTLSIQYPTQASANTWE